MNPVPATAPNSPRRRRSPRLAAAAVLTLATIAGLVGAGAPAPASAASAAHGADDEMRSSFVLPVLPDTQFYSRYSESQFVPQYGTNPFEVQTSWIVEHQDELNMPFTVHVGDVVDQEWVGGEWTAADRAMRILEDGDMPYSIVPGNHDVANSGGRSSAANSGNYLAHFGEDAMARQAGDLLVDSFQNGLSTAYVFEAEGRRWMSLAIAWNASDDTFEWAQRVLDAHPGVPVILSSHAIISIADDQLSPASHWWGEELWNRLITGNDQIILTVNGHFHGSTGQTRTNDFGNPVHQVLTDYQMSADGGNGILSLFEFDLTNNRIDIETVSPWVTVKDPASIASSDTPVLDGPWQSRSLELDFAQRFGWDAAAVPPTKGDLSSRALEIVTTGWTGSTGVDALRAPGSSEDYITVDGTVAHWRFGSLEAGVVDENTVVPDLVGGSPMYRSPIEHTDAPDELEDVQISHDNRPFYSADAGAVCFDNASRNTPEGERLAYLSTEFGAPATMADLTSDRGYTIETFLQLDEAWTESNNRWSAALTRTGVRSWTGINDSADPGAGVSWLGISSLREYQFSAADTGTRNSYTLWSGEIMQGSWHHVAIVNDPVARTAIMYVDGVPVLRNANNVGGMVAADFMPWVLGASTNENEPNHGWLGCVGETRIVDRALSADEFLTARVDIDGTGDNFAVTTDLSGVRAADDEITVIEGNGYAGAEVRLDVDGVEVGRATVAPDGTWRISLTVAITGTGAYALTFVQSLGTRDGAPLEAAIVIGDADEWSPVESDLSVDTEGRISIDPSTFEAGATVTALLPEQHDGGPVVAVAFPGPVTMVAGGVDDARVAIDTPLSLTPGSYRFALYTSDGELIGWTTVEVTEPAGGGAPVSGDGTDGQQADDGRPVDGAPDDGGLAATGLPVGSVLLMLGLAAVGLAALTLGVLRARRGRSDRASAGVDAT